MIEKSTEKNNNKRAILNFLIKILIGNRDITQIIIIIEYHYYNTQSQN